MLALIDGDSIIYKAGFSSEERYYHIFHKDNQEFPVASVKYAKEIKDITGGSDEFIVQKEIISPELDTCILSVNSIIKSILTFTGANKYRVYLSPSVCFRNEIYKEYKANRDPSQKPTHFKEIKEYLITKYKASIVEGYEADDCIYTDSLVYGNVVIVSIDKDLDQIEGLHFNYSTNDKYYVTPQEAEYNKAKLLLCGDTADNIKGIPGIGKIKAARFLKEATPPYLEDIEKEYIRVYGNKGAELFALTKQLVELKNINAPRIQE